MSITSYPWGLYDPQHTDEWSIGLENQVNPFSAPRSSSVGASCSPIRGGGYTRKRASSDLGISHGTRIPAAHDQVLVASTASKSGSTRGVPPNESLQSTPESLLRLACMGNKNHIQGKQHMMQTTSHEQTNQKGLPQTKNSQRIHTSPSQCPSLSRKSSADTLVVGPVDVNNSSSTARRSSITVVRGVIQPGKDAQQTATADDNRKNIELDHKSAAFSDESKRGPLAPPKDVEKCTGANGDEDEDGAMPPPDRGPAAWRVLVASAAFEGVFWGFPLSFGVFEEYYSHLPQYQDNLLVPYVGTIPLSIAYIGAPLMIPLIAVWPQFQRQMIWVGWTTCVAALFASAFAPSIAVLMLTQGIMYGVGYLLLFYPLVSMLNEWWIDHRGFAWGVVVSSASLAGVAFPFITESLLGAFGLKTTLLSLSIGSATLTAPLLLFFRQRLSPSQQKRQRQVRGAEKVNWAFLRQPIFWFYAISIAVQGLGFTLPSLFLPSYASSLGLSRQTGALLLALLFAAQVVGQLVYGYLSDGRVSLNILLLSSSLVASIAVFALWGLGKSLVVLIFFVLVYGFFACGYMALRIRAGTQVTKDESCSTALFCIFSFVQGIGYLLAGPLSGVLLAADTEVEEYGFAKYRSMVVFAGCALAVSALVVVIPVIHALVQRKDTSPIDGAAVQLDESKEASIESSRRGSAQQVTTIDESPRSEFDDKFAIEGRVVRIVIQKSLEK